MSQEGEIVWSFMDVQILSMFLEYVTLGDLLELLSLRSLTMP